MLPHRFDIVVVRSADEAAAARELWSAVPWGREEAELDVVLTRVRQRESAVAPFGVFVLRDGRPAAGAVGRLERRQLAAGVGYRALYRPSVDALVVPEGGVFAADGEAAGALTAALDAELAKSDVLTLPALSVGGELDAAVVARWRGLRRQPFVAPWSRRLLHLPASWEEFLASRPRKIRFGLRYDAKKLEQTLGQGLEVARPDTAEVAAAELEAVAAAAYQRALGGGYVDDPESRALLRLGLERGWTDVWVLRDAGKAIAYWLCARYRGTIHLRTTGYDPAYARHRPGIYLLSRVIADACADTAVTELDFGPGDSAYKRQLSDHFVTERNHVVYAATLRARRIALGRAAVLGAGRAARRMVDAAAITDALRARSRARATR